MVELVMGKDHMDKLYKSKNPLVKIVSVGRLDKIARVIEKMRGDREIKILDAGCGEGHLLEKISERGYNNLFGVDVTDVALESAAKRVPKAELSLQDISKFSFEDKSFDIVVCTEVIEHVENYNEVLTELKRILKDDGLLILTFPNEPLCVAMRIAFLRRPIPKDHVSFYSVRKMKKLVGLRLKEKINLPWKNFPNMLSLIHLLVFSKE